MGFLCLTYKYCKYTVDFFTGGGSDYDTDAKIDTNSGVLALEDRDTVLGNKAFSFFLERFGEIGELHLFHCLI